MQTIEESTYVHTPNGTKTEERINKNEDKLRARSCLVCNFVILLPSSLILFHFSSFPLAFCRVCSRVLLSQWISQMIYAAKWRVRVQMINCTRWVRRIARCLPCVAFSSFILNVYIYLPTFCETKWTNEMAAAPINCKFCCINRPAKSRVIHFISSSPPPPMKPIILYRMKLF